MRRLLSASFWVPACVMPALLVTSCGKYDREEMTVMRGTFRQSITETGVLQSVNAVVVPTPNIDSRFGYYYKITGLIEHGKQVHEGDSVAALDPSSLYKFLIDREEDLEKQKAVANKKKVEMENSYQELKARLKNEEAAYELKKLELERSKFEPEAIRKVKEMEFRQSTIRLNKVKRNLELNPVLENYDMKIQKIRVAQRENDIANARASLALFTVYSPGDGIFQLQQNRRTGQQTRLGDEIYRGSLLARIPDITRMKALSYVSEIDIRKIRKGMKVIVRLDAMPNVSFDGIITHVDKVCTVRDKENVFRTEIDILESDLSLKPGMSVSCEYICYESADDLYVPNQCLQRENGHSWIFIRKRGSVEKVAVTAGPANASHTVIEGDVRPGQPLVSYDRIENNNIE